MEKAPEWLMKTIKRTASTTDAFYLVGIGSNTCEGCKLRPRIVHTCDEDGINAQRPVLTFEI